MQQVTWPSLLPLALRLQVWRALVAKGYSLENPSDDEASLELDSQFKRTAAAQVGPTNRKHRDDNEANAGPAIDGYFARVHRELTELAAPAAGNSEPAKLRLSVLLETSNLPLCRQCCAATSGADQHLCRWTERSAVDDIDAVATRGHCIEPVRELFQVACDVARGAYGKALSEPPAQMLMLETRAADERNDDLDIALHAATFEKDPLRVRRVELGFHVESLEVRDYLALLYVLMHECLVHGFCGVDVEDAASLESVSFHEGWMDCLAAECVEQLAGNALVASGHPASRHLAEFVSEMGTVRTTRFNTGRPQNAASARKWRRGRWERSALLRVLRAALYELTLERDEEPSNLEARALWELRRFSLLMNASDLPHEERGAFGSALNFLLNASTEQEQRALLEENEQVVDFAKIFVSGGHWKDFVEAVVRYAETK